MVGLIINAIIMNEVKNIMGAMGIPSNERTDKLACAIGQCLVEYAIAPTQEAKREAIERCFNSAGLTEWRGTAMAEAVMQTLDNAPMLTSLGDFVEYADGAGQDLSSLMSSLQSFEAAGEDDDEDEDYDEDDDDDWREDEDDDDTSWWGQEPQMPSIRQALSAKAKAQPRDSKGRFVSSKPAQQPQEEEEVVDFGDPYLNLLFALFAD